MFRRREQEKPLFSCKKLMILLKEGHAQGKT
jgi:hypothetical protein